MEHERRRKFGRFGNSRYNWSIIAGIKFKKFFIYSIRNFIIILEIVLCLRFTSSGTIKQGEFRGSMVLDEVPLIDGHNDLPYNLYLYLNNEIDNFNFDSDLTQDPIFFNKSSSYTDLPRLRKGKVGGQFWVAYVSCNSNDRDAVELTLNQIDVTKRLINMYPNDMKFVTTAAGIEQAFAEKKIASLLCVEGGHSIDSRMSVLRLYYELGVRYMTLTHNCNTPWAEQHGVDGDSLLPRTNGLTAWGKDLVLEMNRLGMMVDLSHVSKQVMVDAITTSRAPVIYSHSSSYQVRNHTRNVQDDVLKLLQANNGIIMLNFYPGFIGTGNYATIDTLIAHLNHIKSVIGSRHIGLGGDYDGVNNQPVGLEDVSKYPDLFDRLAESGHGYEPWTREELQQLAGLNLIRVLKDVETVRNQLSHLPPYDIIIPDDDLRNHPTNYLSCRTDFDRRMFDEL